MAQSDPELVEILSAAAHDGWMEGKRAQGVETRKSEWGEELMVPYPDLSEKAKDLDRYNVRSILAAIDRAGLVLLSSDQAAKVERLRSGLNDARKTINTYILYGANASEELRAKLDTWKELVQAE